MGEVYLAQDTREANLQRKVALKVLRRTSATEREDVQRFKQEAYAASALNHPNIIAVFEIGEQEEQHFIATEFVEGQTLQQRMKSGPIDLREALHIGIQIADAIAAAHDAGIVHRDIKPANIMLRDDGYIKIVDFGVAKLIERRLAAGAVGTNREASDWEVHTNPGWAIGTPRYMAPEQFLAQEPDGRCDIYSLGIVLYELVAGRAPFEGSSPDNVMAALSKDAPPLRVYAPETSPELERIVGKAIVRDREQRYLSARELLTDLKNLQLDVEIGLRESGKQAGLKEQVAHRRIANALRTAAVGLLAMASAAGLFWLDRGGNSARSAHGKPSLAVLPFADMSPGKNQEYIGDGLAAELLDALSKIPGLRVAGRTSTFQFKGKNEDVSVIAKKLNVTAILEGSVRKQGNRARISVQLINAADGFQVWSDIFDRELDDIFMVQEEIARAVTGALKIKLLGGKPATPAPKPPKPEAYNAYLMGRYFLHAARNKENLEKAENYFERAVQVDPDYAPAWAGLGKSISNLAGWGYIPDGEGYRKAREAIERALKLNPNLGEAYAFLADIQQYRDWDWARADASFQRALGLEPGNVVAIGGAAGLAWIRGDLDEAIVLFRRAIEIDPLYPNLYVDLGLVLNSAGRYEEAKIALNKALELAPDTQGAHAVLSRVYLLQSHPQKALAEAQKEKHPIMGLCSAAMAYHALGLKKEADADLAEAIAKFQETAPYEIATVYAFRGEADQAFHWLDRAYAELDGGLSEIKGDPLMNSLKHDSRYAALLQKLHLL
jgi:serine/threonine-protein kinase